MSMLVACVDLKPWKQINSLMGEMHWRGSTLEGRKIIFTGAAWHRWISFRGDAVRKATALCFKEKKSLRYITACVFVSLSPQSSSNSSKVTAVFSVFTTTPAEQLAAGYVFILMEQELKDAWKRLPVSVAIAAAYFSQCWYNFSTRTKVTV